MTLAAGPSDNRIKLLTMLTNFHIGGTERQVTNLALRLDSSRFDLHLACLRNSGELLQEIETLRVPKPVFEIGSLYGLKTAWQALRFAHYVRKNRIQIVNSYGFYPNVFAVVAAKFGGAGVVIASIRDRGDILTPAQRRFQKIVCRLADCVLVNAEAIRETLIAQGYDPAKIVVIRNGIVLSRYQRTERSARIRRELGIPADSPIVIMFSRLNRMKGAEYFLEAARNVARVCPGVRFLIVGDGANRRDLEQRAASLDLNDLAIFTGFRTDVQDLLAESAISVLPSLSEGLSNSLLEAMAAGIPVIATKVGGNPEIIEDGVSGLLIPPRDANSLEQATVALLKNPARAQRMGEAGFRRVAELFSVERSVAEVESLYCRLVGGEGRT